MLQQNLDGFIICFFHGGCFYLADNVRWKVLLCTKGLVINIWSINQYKRQRPAHIIQIVLTSNSKTGFTYNLVMPNSSYLEFRKHGNKSKLFLICFRSKRAKISIILRFNFGLLIFYHIYIHQNQNTAYML